MEGTLQITTLTLMDLRFLRGLPESEVDPDLFKWAVEVAWVDGGLLGAVEAPLTEGLGL